MAETKRSRLLATVDTSKVMDLGAAVETLSKCDAVLKANSKPGSGDRTVCLTVVVPATGKTNEAAIRGSIALPHGLGKAKRVAVFAKPDRVNALLEAGAVAAGGADLAAKIKDGFMDFDVVLAAPDMMGVVGPLGRVLGPRGLMPSPKAGTVSDDLQTVLKEFIAGRVEFRADDAGNIHIPVGKLSFDRQKIVENAQAAANAVRALKPATVKGIFVRRMVLTATMLPGITLAE